jgi:SAM-dependent MidA family methyltransferase
LRARIDRGGPMTFRDFMDAALYHPIHGYYTTRPAATTRGGDFVTSPEVHPVFGALVARQIREIWNAMDRPRTFDIVEQGAGRGLLARDVLLASTAIDAEFTAALRYIIIEPRRRLEDEQRETLSEAGLSGSIAWVKQPPDRISGCVLTNELLDAFPVHRVVREGDRLREVRVMHDGSRFADVLGDLSDNAVARYFDDLGLLPGEGCFAEVNLEAPRWLAHMASRIERGAILAFDYGYLAAELYASWRRDGTLLCFYRQSASSDPYQRIGRQDMTACVDFTTLIRSGERAGLATAGFADQSQFLMRLGINDALSSVAAAQIEEYFARRNVVLDLIDPARLGRVKVLLQTKGLGERQFMGFMDG